MLAEFLIWLGTPVPWRYRRLGLLGDSVRLWSRGRRRSRDWSLHERHCHEIVDRAIGRLARYDTVVVLGSGLMRDVSLPVLAKRFRRVVLVDAVHVLPLRLRALPHTNVALLTRDLTGIIDWLTGHATGRELPVQDLAQDQMVDLVISANVLSQLALPIEDWIERRPATAGRLPADIGRRLIDWHLEDLSRFRCRVCLMTDTGFREIAADGAIRAHHDLLHGRPLPAPDLAWDWPVAPAGELGGGLVHVHDACGYADFGKAMA